MNRSDIINGLWELGGGLVYCRSIAQLYRDKEVKGWSPWVTAFFLSWGLWNCWFYPANGLVWSFAGGAVLASANVVYLVMLWYYLKVAPPLQLIRALENKDGTP